jgi:RNA polymerase sigma-70 factor (ECF subfamily)
VQGAAPPPDVDLPRQREIVDAFIAAARGGNIDELVAVLDPDVVLRADTGAAPSDEVHGAREVAGRALMFSHLAPFARRALVNGTPGIVTVRDGEPLAVMGITIAHEKIVALDILADPERLAGLDVTILD